MLPDAGLTVATDGAVYVQGDYNTGTTYGPTGLQRRGGHHLTQPVSNGNVDPTQYTVSGYTQKPAAVMGDAVMILSNAWLDSNSSAGHRLAQRHADDRQHGHRLRAGAHHQLGGQRRRA